MSWKNHETEITCTAEGIPVPEITWIHNGEELSSTQLQNRVSRLTLTPHEAEDFGLYVCIAKNILGTTKMNITVKQLGKEPAALTSMTLLLLFFLFRH